MNRNKFLNWLKILHSIDRLDLELGEVILPGDDLAWRSFCGDPYSWLMRASDERADKVFSIIEQRDLPKRNKVA